MFKKRSGAALYSLPSSPFASPKFVTTSLPTTAQSPSDSPSHGTSARGDPASCALATQHTPGRVVDCSECLQNAFASVIQTTEISLRESASQVRQCVVASGEAGCSIEAICVSFLSRNDRTIH